LATVGESGGECTEYTTAQKGEGEKMNDWLITYWYRINVQRPGNPYYVEGYATIKTNLSPDKWLENKRDNDTSECAIVFALVISNRPVGTKTTEG
jgi:hypothetical protein